MQILGMVIRIIVVLGLVAFGLEFWSIAFSFGDLGSTVIALLAGLICFGVAIDVLA